MSLTKEFYSEEKRLKSFFEKSWPLASLKPQQLAKCGFFYLGDGDRVQCPFCGIVIFNWQSGDLPIFEHKIHSGKCPFINGRDIGNNYIDEDPREIYNLCESEDVCGFTHISPPDQKEEKIIQPVIDPVDVKGISPGGPFKPPQSMEFITYDSRLATFKDWPISKVISPARLAESGFFFKGPVDSRNQHYTDFVSCFHCGIALCQWVGGDDPWQEHRKFNSDCFFTYLVGPPDFASPKTSISRPPSPEPETEPKLELERKPQDESPPSSPESESEPEIKNLIPSSSQPKPFIPFTWLPKPENGDLTCKVCLDLQMGATFFPCLHASCAVCTSSISICPICRTKIEYVTKLDTELVKNKISFYV